MYFKLFLFLITVNSYSCIDYVHGRKTTPECLLINCDKDELNWLSKTNSKWSKNDTTLYLGFENIPRFLYEQKYLGFIPEKDCRFFTLTIDEIKNIYEVIVFDSSICINSFYQLKMNNNLKEFFFVELTELEKNKIKNVFKYIITIWRRSAVRN
jgi:hypothetical protein